MLKAALVEIFERDIRKVMSEIALYENEADLWTLKGEISNSAGTLCLHLVGNLNHFIGATLGNTGYVRTREVEFSARNVPRAEIMENLEKAISVVVNALNGLSEADFNANFPSEKHGKVVSMSYMLLHLLTHLNYHLGQINYHRRLIANK